MVMHRPKPVACHWLIVFVAIAIFVTHSGIAFANCDTPLPKQLRSTAPPHKKRPVTLHDIATLGDIGYPDPLLAGGPSPLALSPDGHLIAFLINRADPDANRYCRALVVMPLKSAGRPRVVDRGGDLITITDVQRGMFVRGGFPAVVTPAWSPDARWLVYLKRRNGRTQAWRVRADGSGADQITHESSDVEAVGWSADGQIIYTIRPALPAVEKSIDREGRSGWLYDDRVVTFSGPRPQIRAAEVPLAAYRIDPRSGQRSPASAAEAATLGLPNGRGLGSQLVALSATNRRAWVDRKGFLSNSDSDLKAIGPNGHDLTCEAAVCHGSIIGLWWSGDGQEVRYLRRQGWNHEQTALYRWRPGGAGPQLVFATLDALTGCIAANGDLICARENATTPRQVVRIDATNGRSQLLFDPNPEFANIDLGRVKRLRWRNNLGLETWGDLVLPPGYKPGERLPLIVVQYSSRGFLRGGTGDEYPIFPLAEDGFAVLSIERPPFVASLDPTVTTVKAFAAANQHHWAERRSLLSAIESGVRILEKRGVVDPDRVGITGLSDGATTARFALINSDLFAAASISSCCLEPWTVNTYVGIAFAEYVQSIGFPSLIKPDPAFWKDMSIAENANRLDTPLLMQLNDDDGYVMALEAFEALREYHQPVEMYVFPNEFHVKWQPIHRLAIYRRNLQWFDFWLRGIEDANPVASTQYEKWRGLRKKRQKQKATRVPG